MAEFTLKLTTTKVKDEDGYTFQGGVDEYMEEHPVSKEVASMISGALEEINLNDL